MTQHGSSPGRPRGRRARHDNDVPDWQGYESTPADQREFPDLSPIRPRQAREAEGRVQGGAPGQGGWRPGGSPAGDRYQPGGPGQPGAQPWPQDHRQGYPQDQQAPGWQAAGQQGPGHGPGPRPGPGQPEQRRQPPGQPGPRDSGWRQEPEEEIPAWAEPDSVEAFSERWHRRGLDSREDRRADRRSRRRLLLAGGTATVLAIAAAVYLLIGGGGPATPGFGALITSFLPGELQSVPNACDTVPGPTLSRYLPGTLKKAAPPLNTGASTECTWTLDKPPTYRVLEVQLVAYSPSALYGNGSATAAAELAFSSYNDNFAHPGPKSGQPPATVRDLSGLPGGTSTSAFQATRVFKRNGAVTDMATVLVRYRNIIITVVVDGLDQATGGKKYGPVAMSELTATAKTVATEVAGKIVH